MGELIFVGLGLHDEKDVTVKGLEEARSCATLFAEFFTSRLMGTTPERLSEVYGRDVQVLTREEVEGGDLVVDAAREKKVGFLVAGDPMAATTHVELRLRAHRAGIKTRVLPGVSSLTAVAGALGLQVYKFGRTISIPFPEKGYRPWSPYQGLQQNLDANLHTLALLDIKGDRYMTASEGMEYLLRLEADRSEGVFTPETLACVVGRLGSPKAWQLAGRVRELLRTRLGPPLHVLVVPGELHFMEVECLVAFAGLPQALARTLIRGGGPSRPIE